LFVRLQIIRGVGGDLVEKVRQIDEFIHPKTGKVSHTYRIEYRSMERSLTNEEVDRIQLVVRERLVEDLNVQLR
jgi:phenylalanyl-tRNA synthetase alpha chain